MKVMKIAEILLTVKFPSIATTPGLGDSTKTYECLQLSKKELEAIVEFSAL